MTEAPAWPCLLPGKTPQASCQLLVAASPNARRTAADGLHDGCLRVRLAAPPVEGQANDTLLAWLARELGLPRRELTLLRGDSSRRKTVQIDAPFEQVQAWLSGLNFSLDSRHPGGPQPRKT